MAFDFRAATMENVSTLERFEGEENLAALARNFDLASEMSVQR